MAGDWRTTPEVMGAALAHHRAGRLDEAAALYELILAGQPLHPDALHYFGVVCYQRGDNARAVELIGRAAGLIPDSPACHSNLAEAYRGLGKYQEAEASCRRALTLRPKYPEAMLNLAVALFQQRRFQDAEQACRSALSLRSAFPPAVLALADALREQWRVAESLEQYRHALELDPNSWTAHANYGLLLVERGQLEEGLRHCREAVNRAPGEALPWQNLGALLLQYGSMEEAMGALEEALKLAPGSTNLCLVIGQAWAEMADYAEARRWFAKALELDSNLTPARCLLADVVLEAGDAEAAAAIYGEILAKEPERAEALAGLARVRLDQGDVDGSVACFRGALRLRPEAAQLHAMLGHTLSTAGDLEGAIDCQRKAILLNPTSAGAHGGLLTTLGKKATDAELQSAEQLLAQPWMTDERRATLHFGLAHSLDARGEWDRAAEHMVQANGYKKRYLEERGLGYDPAAHTRHVDRLIEAFTPEFFERVRGLGDASDRPVFVVGLPRSSTTLTEQILASHPRVYGAGERPFAGQALARLPGVLVLQADPLACLSRADGPALRKLAAWHLEQLRKLDGGRADRIVDKMPDNYQMLGWLAAVFPRARFIHCRRDVRDVALSCWITHFAKIRWAFDLEHIVHRIREYWRIMAHWRRVLPAPLLEVDYEELVANQERVSRRLVDWVGVEWDEKCLSFHKTERLVRTASVTQVRQPIYRRSVARWKHYEAMLKPLLDAIGQAADAGHG
jgi:tetratricopeptide (TPR) repeat protein